MDVCRSRQSEDQEEARGIQIENRQYCKWDIKTDYSLLWRIHYFQRERPSYPNP